MSIYITSDNDSSGELSIIIIILAPSPHIATYTTSPTVYAILPLKTEITR